jgi:hypothetical protein
MSVFKETVKETMENNTILNSCCGVEKFYCYGMYIDLCGLEPKDIVENIRMIDDNTELKYTLTINGNVYENIPYNSDITTYLTYQPQEGMSHKWMEGNTEFIGKKMPKRNLILNGVYEKITESNLIYYGQLINNNAKNMTSEGLNLLNSFEYVINKEIKKTTLQPKLEPWVTRPARSGESQTEWYDNYGAVFYIAVPKNLNVIVKNESENIEMSVSNIILSKNNTEYKQYYQTTPYLPSNPDSIQNEIEITIMITK